MLGLTVAFMVQGFVEANVLLSAERSQHGLDNFWRVRRDLCGKLPGALLDAVNAIGNLGYDAEIVRLPPG